MPDSATGTLILFVPTKDGLVVAADSRSNIAMGGNVTVPCDEAEKIAPLKHHKRTVVAVTGTDKSFHSDGQPASSDDPCKYFVSMRPVLDSTQVALSYLDGQTGEITKDVYTALETHFLQKVEAIQAEYPGTLSNNKDGAFASIVLGRYIPNDNLSVVAHFTVRIQPDGRPEISDRAWHEYRIADERRVEAMGESNFVKYYAVGDFGRKLLGAGHLERYGSYLNHTAISTATKDQGSDAAVDLIQSGEILSGRVPEGNTIGGPIHVFLLDKEHQKPLLLQ